MYKTKTSGVIFAKNHQKTPHSVNHEVFRNIDNIVLINVLRQLTSSNCSHICKRLKSQQLCQLHQFSKKVQKTPTRNSNRGFSIFQSKMKFSRVRPVIFVKTFNKSHSSRRALAYILLKPEKVSYFQIQSQNNRISLCHNK